MPFTDIVDPVAGKPTSKDWAALVNANLIYLNNNVAASLGGLIINYSFETDADSDGEADGWEYTNYTGGSNALEQSNESGGVNSQSFTSTVLANGGGYADSTDFFEVTGDTVYRFGIWRHASVANVSCNSSVIWYTDAQVQIAGVSIFQDTDTPISRAHKGDLIQAPSNARYAKIRIRGGVPAVGTATGTVYFDAVYFDSVSSGWQAKSITEFSSDVNIELDVSNNNQHLIIFSGIKPSADSQEMICEFSQDGGSTWKTANYAYGRTEITGTTETHASSSSASNLPITDAAVMGIGNAPAPWSGDFRFFKHSNGQSQFQWRLTGQENTGNAINRYQGHGWYDANTNPITNIRFDIGTFVTGNCIHMVAD